MIPKKEIDLLTITSTIDLDHMLDIVLETIEDRERSDLVLLITKWLVQEIECYGGELSEVQDIKKAVNILRGE
jgi:hypothetical protein